MLRKLWIILVIWFKTEIWYPIKARWNYIMYGAYIPDNMRNRALLDFCEKVAMDPTYQPEGIYENMFEERLREVYDSVMDYSKKTFPDEVDWLTELDYETERPYCAAIIYQNLLQLLWIED